MEVHVVGDPVPDELSCSVAFVLIELLALAAEILLVPVNVVGCDLIIFISAGLPPALSSDPFQLLLLTFSPNSVGLEVVVAVLDRAPGVVERCPLLVTRRRGSSICIGSG